MFLTKNLMTSLILPPGIFVCLLLFSGIYFLYRGSKKSGLVNLFAAICLWGLSISPVANVLVYGLESGFSIPENPKGDVILLLGGGIIDDVPDLTGKGVPSAAVMWRIATAVRLHKQLNLPMIVSGGGKNPEAPVVGRFLRDLGVADDAVILEDKSRDTKENARFIKEICRKNKFRQPILVTSALHLKRAVIAFDKHRLQVTPFPAVFNAQVGREFDLLSYFPSIQALSATTVALREYIGILHYRLFL